VTTAIVERLPVPTRDRAPEAFRTIAAGAALLARRWDETVFIDLNVRVAQLYELSCDELDHVLDTFPLVDQGIRHRIRTEFRQA
jgi:hypothetical protein